MFCAGIVGNELVGPGNLQCGVKMFLDAFITFLKENLEPCFNAKPIYQ